MISAIWSSSYHFMYASSERRGLEMEEVTRRSPRPVIGWVAIARSEIEIWGGSCLKG